MDKKKTYYEVWANLIVFSCVLAQMCVCLLSSDEFRNKFVQVQNLTKYVEFEFQNWSRIYSLNLNLTEFDSRIWSIKGQKFLIRLNFTSTTFSEQITIFFWPKMPFSKKSFFTHLATQQHLINASATASVSTPNTQTL